MVTAEVKDKASLEDSLDLFVAEELFSGDNKLEDPDAGRKVGWCGLMLFHPPLSSPPPIALPLSPV